MTIILTVTAIALAVACLWLNAQATARIEATVTHFRAEIDRARSLNDDAAITAAIRRSERERQLAVERANTHRDTAATAAAKIERLEQELATHDHPITQWLQRHGPATLTDIAAQFRWEPDHAADVVAMVAHRNQIISVYSGDTQPQPAGWRALGQAERAELASFADDNSLTRLLT